MRNMPNSSPIIKISQDIFLRHNHINRLSYSKQARLIFLQPLFCDVKTYLSQKSDTKKIVKKFHVSQVVTRHPLLCIMKQGKRMYNR